MIKLIKFITALAFFLATLVNIVQNQTLASTFSFISGTGFLLGFIIDLTIEQRKSKI